MNLYKPVSVILWCVIRPMSSTESGANRPLNPVDAVHPFGASRPANPEHAVHFSARIGIGGRHGSDWVDDLLWNLT
jgi:hypothetical protein